MVHGAVSVYLVFLLLIRSLVGELQARLVGGTEWSGRLEVSSNDTWGTVCGEGFGSNEAQVVCRMLGFYNPGAVRVGSDMFGEGSGSIFLDWVTCNGTENSLEECRYKRSTHCSPNNDVSVICNIPGEMTVRLVKGNRWAGLLEVLYDGVWSTVCSRGFGHKEVQVVCKMLKMQSTRAFAFTVFPEFKGRHEASILFSDLDCDGTETSLAQCKHSGFYNHNCTHDDDISVICLVDTQYRLAGAHRTRPDMGRLEVRVSFLVGEVMHLPYKWRGICGNTYSSITTAKVICNQLSYPSSKAVLVPGSSFGPTEEFWLTEGDCTGDETSLNTCVQLVTGFDSSCPTQDIGVICSDSLKSLYVVASDGEYPFIEGEQTSLKCENAQLDKHVTNYSWPKTAGGTPSGQFLIFDNVSKDLNWKRVRCAGSYGESNSHLVYSDEMTPAVYYKPVIEIISSAPTCRPQKNLTNVCLLTRGQNVTISCSAISNPQPASYKWFGKITSTTADITITQAEQETDAGTYICVVETKTYADDQRSPLSSSYQFTVIVQSKTSKRCWPLYSRHRPSNNMSSVDTRSAGLLFLTITKILPTLSGCVSLRIM